MGIERFENNIMRVHIFCIILFLLFRDIFWHPFKLSQFLNIFIFTNANYILIFGLKYISRIKSYKIYHKLKLHFSDIFTFSSKRHINHSFHLSLFRNFQEYRELPISYTFYLVNLTWRVKRDMVEIYSFESFSSLFFFSYWIKRD